MWLKTLFKTLSVLLYSTLLLILIRGYKIDFDPFAYADSQFPSHTSFKTLLTQISPILKELSHLKFFKYFRVDISRECPFWQDSPLCSSTAMCTLKCPCPSESLPKVWLEEDLRIREQMSFSALYQVDISKPDHFILSNWTLDMFGNKTLYVDLTKDKEQYTGYNGQRIWNSLYSTLCEEITLHCGPDDPIFRILSGMHTSVSSHLSEHFVKFYKTRELVFSDEKLYFDKVGRFPERMQNLVFAVQILIEALVKLGDSLLEIPIDTEDFSEDIKSRNLIQSLVSAMNNHAIQKSSDVDILARNKSQLSGNNVSSIYLKFVGNLTQVMDCIDCQKCKVYGKMQVLGVGVALRCLLTQKPSQITRNELVAFLNTLTKWIESIEIIDKMKHRFFVRKSVKFFILTFAEILVLFLINSMFRQKKMDSSEEKKSCCHN